MNGCQKVLWCALGLLAAASARADWQQGDPYKMHYPQLPDPQGWDVAFDELIAEGSYRGPLGDDWQCTQSGIVNDIHLWVSFREDQAPAGQEYVAGFVEIYSNSPAGEGYDYSRPNQRLWGMGFDTNQAHVKLQAYGTGAQGWYEPFHQVSVRPDHEQYYQVNITKIASVVEQPFEQTQGSIYWLVSHMMVLDQQGNRVDGKQIGWKSSLSTQFMDDAVYGNPSPVGPMWTPIVDPATGASLDLAFVITGVPEPSALWLLLLGGLASRLPRTRRAR